jgi:hypothetical protein
MYNGPPPKGMQKPPASPPPPPKTYPVERERPVVKEPESESGFWGGAFTVGILWWIFG